MKPALGLLLVKPIKTAESFGGSSVILLEETRARWTGAQCEVVAIGEIPHCDDEGCELEHWSNEPTIGVYHGRHFFPVRVGDWCVVKPRCYVPTDIEDLWVIRQDDVLAILGVTGNIR